MAAIKYPFTPELLDALPEELAELFRSLEQTLLVEICSRFMIADQLNEVSIQDIRALRSHGISLEDIEKAIREYTETSEKKLDELFDNVVEWNQQYYTELIDIAQVTKPQTLVDERDIDAIRRQTHNEFTNLTRSMAFVVRYGAKQFPLHPRQAYQWAVDNAVLQVQSGAISYNEAIRNAVKQLADSGIKAATYTGGRMEQIDSVVRRSVMTAVNQINARYNEQSMEYLQTDLVEVSAHLGARNTDGPHGWENHAAWQGKVYRWKKYPQTSNGQYADFEDTCGYGDVTGILGANCRHSFSAFVEGVMERTYTDKELEEMRPQNRKKTEFEGKEYDDYQSTQMQRRLEAEIRKQRRRRDAYKAAGLDEDAQVASIRLKRLEREYKDFSKAAGLPMQHDRMQVLYSDPAHPNYAVIDALKTNGDRSSVTTIGKIDIEKYRAVSDNIRTDEVVITNERISHIKINHPNDFERYSKYIETMVERPQYILKDSVPNTAVILQEFADANEHFRLILKLAVIGDESYKKNSIITFLKISEKKFKKYLRNKTILYKDE